MLADALNWAGVNEDAFQASLDGCNSEQERAALITDTLNGLYQEAADNYKELNGDVMEAQRAQALLTDAYAQLGAIAEPIMTTLKTMAADVLTAMIPFVSLMGEGLQGVLEGTAGAAETFAEGVSGLVDVLMEKLSTIVPMIGEALLASLPVLLEAGANIITTLVGGIVAALPELAAAALSIILQLVTSLTELLPQILAAAMQVVATLAQGIGTAMPTLIPAVVQLVFSGSISSIAVDGVEKNSLKYVQYRYKLTSASSYGTYTSILADVTQNGTSFSFSNLELCSLDANSSYDFHLYIRDQLNTLSALNLYFTVPQGTPLVALRKKMVGINTPSPEAALHVVGDTRIEGTLIPDIIDYPFDKPYFGICDTAADTAAKVVTCDEFSLKKGALLAVQFTNANTANSISMNVNGTGAIAVCGLNGYYVQANMWVANQMVHFVYNGTWWIALNCLTATTARYGLTMLSSSASSTSISLAATPYAVKQAYDRNSWTSISLTNALAVAYGGTGATTAATARSNLGIACTSLYNGTLTSGSITFNYGNYNFYVIIGRPSSSASRVSLVVPRIQLTTTATAYQIADESNYKSFNLSYSGTTVTLTMGNGNGQINRVFGVN